MAAERILIVEDEASYRVLFSKILSSAGYVAVTCKAGDEAIDALAHATFDLVILDYKLPGPSGLNILQWLYGRKSNLPVIVITGYANDDLELEANKWGVSLFLEKAGFDPLKLPDIIPRVLDEHRRRSTQNP